MRTFLMLCAMVMAILPTISINAPGLSTLDISRMTLVPSAANNVSEIRFGVWSFCLHRQVTSGDICDTFSPCDLNGVLRLCSKHEYAYEMKVMGTQGGATEGSERMQASYTRVLACHVAYSVMIGICLLLLICDCQNLFILHLSLDIAALTLLLDFIFCMRSDTIAKHLSKIDVGVHSRIGPGFGLTLLSACLLFFEERAASYASKTSTTTTSAPSRRGSSVVQTLERARPVLPVHVEPYTSSLSRSNLNERNNEKFSFSFSRSSIQRPKEARPKTHRRATDGLPGSECPICLERKTTLSELPCRHVFCTECIGKAVNLYDRCPLCNKKSKAQDLRRVSMSSFV